MAANVDWNAIKAEYITSNISYRNLAAKHCVPFKTLAHRAKQEKWTELRQRHRDKIVTKMANNEARKQINRYQRILNVTDRLLEKIEQSITELDLQTVTKIHKTKTIEYRNTERPDKPTKEIIDETQTIDLIKTIIDKNGLKQVASALRDLKEIQMVKSDLDQEEQEARIEKLRKDVASNDVNKEIKVTISGELEEYSN